MTTEATQVVDDENNINPEDLFNEIVNGKDSKADSDDVEGSLGHQADDELETEAEGESTDDSQASAAKPNEGEGEGTENPPEASEGDEANPVEDIWSGASEAQLKALRDLQHERQQLHNDVRANAGRVQGYARKVKELEEALAKQTKAGQSQQQAGAGDLQLEGKTLQEVEEDYPEIAAFVRHQTQATLKQFRDEFAPVAQRTEQLSQHVESDREAKAREATRRELDRLYEAHPDYTEISRSDNFKQWLGSKPDSIRALANSMSAADNIELLNLFKSQTAPPPPPANSGRQSKRDLKDHVEIPRKGAAPPAGMPEDPEELFNLVVSQRKHKQ